MPVREHVGMSHLSQRALSEPGGISRPPLYDQAMGTPPGSRIRRGDQFRHSSQADVHREQLGPAVQMPPGDLNASLPTSPTGSRPPALDSVPEERDNSLI
jgi:hypothetical protein